MPRKFLDISVPLENDVAADPPQFKPRITYVDHRASVPQILSFFPGLTAAELPDGEGWALESVTLSTHNGTHVDAPYHYASTMDKGQRASTIDEMPLDWFFQPGIKLDFRHFPDGYIVQPDDIAAELQRCRHELRPLEIVIVNTRAGSRYGSADYVNSGCGMGRAATLYLLEQGIRVVGTDAWSWDPPFVYTIERYRTSHDASIVWEGHRAGRDIGYCQIEKLHSLEQLPSTGLTVSCFPVKIRAASAGWTRAVAMFDS